MKFCFQSFNILFRERFKQRNFQSVTICEHTSLAFYNYGWNSRK